MSSICPLDPMSFGLPICMIIEELKTMSISINMGLKQIPTASEQKIAALPNPLLGGDGSFRLPRWQHLVRKLFRILGFLL